MRVVVLAAGFATRLYPLTLNTPKPLLDIAGKSVLTRLLNRVVRSIQPTEIVVVTNDRFEPDFERWRDSYDCSVPIRILSDGTTTNENRLGAVADMALAIESCEYGEEPLLVVAGDNLIDFDLSPFAARFDQGAGPLLLVREVPEPVPPGRFSEVLLGEDGSVIRFREKPSDPQSALSAVCLYFFPGSIRQELERYAAEGHNLDAPGYFLEWLHDHQPLRAERITGPFHDIGNLQTLEQARRAFDSTPTSTP